MPINIVKVTYSVISPVPCPDTKFFARALRSPLDPVLGAAPATTGPATGDRCLIKCCGRA